MTFNELLMYYGDHRECGLEHGEVRLKPIIAEIERRCGTHAKDTAKDIAAAQLRLQDWADNPENFDEDGPPPPTADAVATARAMLRVMAAMNQYRFRGISVGGDGEITISFEDDDGKGECFYANPSGKTSWRVFDIIGNTVEYSDA